MSGSTSYEAVAYTQIRVNAATDPIRNIARTDVHPEAFGAA
jgi:hypothetical protein